MVAQCSPVKTLALERRLPLYQPATLKDDVVLERLGTVTADVMVVAAYGLILPQAVLDIPRHGALNIHASLLPRWRGAAPIQRALLAGDSSTGISIMRMDAGLDTGPVLLARRTAIDAQDTAGTLEQRLADIGATLIVEALERLGRATLEEHAQDESRATLAPKLQKAEVRIDWHADAARIQRQIRAFNPAPGCTSRIRGVELKLWRAAIAAASEGTPGCVLQADTAGVVVACGQGALRVTELQRPGGRKMPAAEFLRGFALAPGERFEP
jgi:methionyl-tRNA formyltransferase